MRQDLLHTNNEALAIEATELKLEFSGIYMQQVMIFFVVGAWHTKILLC